MFSWGIGLLEETMISSKTVPEDLNSKLRSKFNLVFTKFNNDCLHGAILKALCDFKKKKKRLQGESISLS